jgi:acyl-coenzyme A synthetase/AMP-(fatty) acid ligase
MQAGANPDRALLEIGAVHITYREMDTRVDRLAQWLLDHSGAPGRRIGLQASDTEALALGALAIRRAGMIPIPLDPTAPGPWVGRALADAGASLLLSDVAVASADIPCAVVHPGAVGSEPPPGGVVESVPDIGSITYTSGSTGEPKGVVLPPGVGFGDSPYLSMATAGLEPEAVRIGFFGYGSVGFMQGIVLGCVAIGATIAAYDIRSRGIHGLGSWLAKSRIWAVVAVPTVLRHFVAVTPSRLQWPDLRLIFLYGEAATWEDLAGLWPHVGPQAFVISLYGSTEAGGISLMVVTPNSPAGTGRLPAGTLSPGVTVTIEDDAYRPLPVGEVGEIVAWTESGGQGYWNRPEESARVFGTSDEGRTFVRTGDLGRIRPDGLLEQIGRMDDMVKVSGHRVALSEIEGTLRQLPGVVDAAAVPLNDTGGNVRIIAHVVSEDGTAPEAAALRAGLASRLPAGAIPDRIVFVAGLPMLANGKVDRNALRAASQGRKDGKPDP